MASLDLLDSRDTTGTGATTKIHVLYIHLIIAPPRRQPHEETCTLHASPSTSVLSLARTCLHRLLPLFLSRHMTATMLALRLRASELTPPRWARNEAVSLAGFIPSVFLNGCCLLLSLLLAVQYDVVEAHFGQCVSLGSPTKHTVKGWLLGAAPGKINLTDTPPYRTFALSAGVH